MHAKQGPHHTDLIRFFGSTSRARILALLFSRPYQPLYQREIMSETGLSLQAVQRELQNLVDLGILNRSGTNQRVYYQISSSSYFFRPLTEIFTSVG